MGTSGDERNARALWVAVYPALSSYCAGVLADRELGRDVAAEAFVRLWSRWSTVSEPRAFLYTVSTNLCRDHWRRAGRERRTAARLGPVAEQQAVDPWLRDLVDRLPERLRLPVLLHYYADLPLAQVAIALRRPEGTIKAQLHEARRLLAVRIKDAS